MRLYKELDSLTRDEDIDRFASQLVDRFGPLPEPSLQLLNLVKARNIAQSLGMERVVLKNGQASLYLVADQTSPFYKSSIFPALIGWIQQHPRRAALKQIKEKLCLALKQVTSIADLLSLLVDMDKAANMSIDLAANNAANSGTEANK